MRANKGVGQEIGVVIVMNRSQNICAVFFSFSTKELTRGYFFHLSFSVPAIVQPR